MAYVTHTIAEDYRTIMLMDNWGAVEGLLLSLLSLLSSASTLAATALDIRVDEEDNDNKVAGQDDKESLPVI
jgi:hypothetical protein